MSVAFFCEQLGNINTIRATIGVSPDCAAEDDVDIKDNKLYLKSTELVDFNAVGVEVDPRVLAISPCQDDDVADSRLALYDVKLAVLRASRLESGQLKELWPAKEIERGLSGITCRHCHCALSRSTQFQCKNLPSEHWYELVECWICHETKPEEHRTRMRAISAKSNHVLVGSTYFLLHPNDLENETIKVDDEVASKVVVS